MISFHHSVLTVRLQAQLHAWASNIQYYSNTEGVLVLHASTPAASGFVILRHLFLSSGSITGIPGWMAGGLRAWVSRTANAIGVLTTNHPNTPLARYIYV